MMKNLHKNPMFNQSYREKWQSKQEEKAVFSEGNKKREFWKIELKEQVYRDIR